jgi:hypothetical protein
VYYNRAKTGFLSKMIKSPMQNPLNVGFFAVKAVGTDIA